VLAVSVPTGDFTVTAYNSTTNTPACGNKVTVSYPFVFMIPSLMPYGPITLTATGCNNG
jgi:hypothetical protein